MSWDGCVFSLSFVPTAVFKEPPEWKIRDVTFPLALSSFRCLTLRPRCRSLTHVFSSRIHLAWIRVARAGPRIKRGSIPSHRYAFLSKGACRSCPGSRNTRPSPGVPIGLTANASFRPVGTVTTHEHAPSYGACISPPVFVSPATGTPMDCRSPLIVSPWNGSKPGVPFQRWPTGDCALHFMTRVEARGVDNLHLCP